MGARMGEVVDEICIEGTPLVIMKCFLPVAQSFGFTAFLREKTSGKAFPNSNFDHWEAINGEISNKDSKLAKLVMQIRKRKNLKEEIPEANMYLDKL